MKLYRLTKLGHQLVKEALKKFEGISDFAIAKHQHRQNFTKFHDGGGVKRDTAETYCNELEIPKSRQTRSSTKRIELSRRISRDISRAGSSGNRKFVSQPYQSDIFQSWTI